MLCTAVKHFGSGGARKKCRGKHETQSRWGEMRKRCCSHFWSKSVVDQEKLTVSCFVNPSLNSSPTLLHVWSCFFVFWVLLSFFFSKFVSFSSEVNVVIEKLNFSFTSKLEFVFKPHLGGLLSTRLWPHATLTLLSCLATSRVYP